TPLAYVRSYAVAAVDPGWQLLQAPIFAVPTALERAGIQWADLGLIEVHEAFAAQVLSNFQGWAAKGWEINPDIINVMGGSIAIGHPRSEEHTSELQSRFDLVCRLLLEKKKTYR